MLLLVYSSAKEPVICITEFGSQFSPLRCSPGGKYGGRGFRCNVAYDCGNFSCSYLKRSDFYSIEGIQNAKRAE